VIAFDDINFGKKFATIQPLRKILHVLKGVFVGSCD
jgi:hypothetical protein